MNIWEHTSLVLGFEPKFSTAAKPEARLQANPIPFHAEARYVGLGPSNQPQPDTLLQESLGWSAIATKAIADRVASLEFIPYRRLRGGDKEELEPEHPLARVLRAGSALHGPRQSKRLVAQYLTTLGDAYLLKVRGRELPVPVELWVMNAARVTPIPVGGMIPRYLVTTGSGAQVTIPAEDVVRIWWPDPENIYGGEGLLGPQGIVVDTSKFADQTMRSHFEHNAMPRGVIEAADGAMPQTDEIERANELWRQRFNRRAGSDRGLPAWLPSGFKLHELEALGGLTEITPMLQHWRDQVLAAYGTPRSILGDVVDANRAAAETNQYVFDTHTIRPIADLIAEAMTLQLAAPDFGPEFTVEVKEFAPADKDFDLRRIETELRMKLRSINEVRLANGEDEVAWGDLPVGTIGESPYTGDEEMAEPEPDDPKALEPDDDDDEPRSRAQRVDPAAEWQRFVARERKWAPVFQRAYREVLAVQERAVLAAVRKSSEERAERAPTVDELRKIIERALAVERWTSLFKRKTERVRTAAYQASGQEALKGVGGSGTFSLTSETASRLAASEAAFRKVVSSTSIKRVSRAVVQAMAESAAAGESLGDRTKRVQAAIGDGFKLRRNEAKTIARTEMLKATQAAQIDGFDQSGVVSGKQWNTSMDDAVRDSHQIDGQSVGLDDSFTLPPDPERGVPGERADAPGVGADGSSLSAANTINCRCFVTPVLEDA